jgi:hypothetical protein
MPDPVDRLDEILRAAFGAGVPEPEYDADNAPAEEVPPSLHARIVQEAAMVSTRLLASRVCDAGENAGWKIDDLASEAVGCEEEAKQFLSGSGNPADISPQGLARILVRAQIEPLEWKDLLVQSVASHTLFQQPTQGQLWGRTSGLSPSRRSEQLASSGERERVPVRAERVARGFAEEVLEEWNRLTSGRG